MVGDSEHEFLVKVWQDVLRRDPFLSRKFKSLNEDIEDFIRTADFKQTKNNSNCSDMKQLAGLIMDPVPGIIRIPGSDHLTNLPKSDTALIVKGRASFAIQSFHNFEEDIALRRTNTSLYRKHRSNLVKLIGASEVEKLERTLADRHAEPVLKEMQQESHK